MMGAQEEQTEDLLGMTLREAAESITDGENGLSAASAAAVCASYGAALISRVAARKASFLQQGPEQDLLKVLASEALALSKEIIELALRLDVAEEMSLLPEARGYKASLEAGLDASLALLETAYFGQSLAKRAGASLETIQAYELGTASMLLDAAAGSAVLSTRIYLVKADDPALSRKAEEMIWAITHDRLGLKRQILELVDVSMNKKG